MESINIFQIAILIFIACTFAYIGYMFNQPLEPKKKD
jgi:hypothetical protein